MTLEVKYVSLPLARKLDGDTLETIRTNVSRVRANGYLKYLGLDGGVQQIFEVDEISAGVLIAEIYSHGNISPGTVVGVTIKNSK